MPLLRGVDGGHLIGLGRDDDWVLREDLHLIEGLLLGHLPRYQIPHDVCVEAAALVLIRGSNDNG